MSSLNSVSYRYSFSIFSKHYFLHHVQDKSDEGEQVQLFCFQSTNGTILEILDYWQQLSTILKRPSVKAAKLE